MPDDTAPQASRPLPQPGSAGIARHEIYLNGNRWLAARSGADHDLRSIFFSCRKVEATQEACIMYCHTHAARTVRRNCVKVEVDVLGSPSVIVRTISVDSKQH